MPATGAEEPSNTAFNACDSTHRVDCVGDRRQVALDILGARFESWREILGSAVCGTSAANCRGDEGMGGCKERQKRLGLG